MRNQAPPRLVSANLDSVAKIIAAFRKLVFEIIEQSIDLLDKLHRKIMVRCSLEGGCPSDYIAISISVISIIFLLAKWITPFLIHNVPRPKGCNFWLVAIQVIASFNLLLSIVMALNFLEFRRWHWWRSCYLWATWIEGPLGFGLLLSCRVVQASQLYYVFVKRRLSPVKSYVLLPLILLPWIIGAAIIHVEQPLNYHCHMASRWIFPVIGLHALYVAAMVVFTESIRHIQFRFKEVKDLYRGIIFSTSSIGIWVIAYVLNEIHEEIEWLQVASRFMLLTMASILVLGFFSISISQPLISVMSLRKKACYGPMTMGHALGLSDHGVVLPKEPIQLSEPLEKLLENRKFLQSFMEFADSCLAGESVHFYDEVQLLDKIPVDDPVRRIYMARHIIEKYVVSGARMEINISYRCREEILTTLDLAQTNLFKNAVNELIHLMKTNLLKGYSSSCFFMKLKEETNMMRNVNQTELLMDAWNFSAKSSYVSCIDDPFHEEHSPRVSSTFQLP